MIPHLRETDLLTLAVGAAGIAGMILLERWLPRIPAALVVLLGSIGVSVAFDLQAQGVHVVGELPAGLGRPVLPGVGLDALPLLLAGAIGIALVAFAEAIGPANEFAREHGGRIDPNRELIAIGASNTGAGLFTGFPIGSSLSKSAANDRAGAQTPASLVLAAAATALVALFLTPLFEPLPEATLGAIVIVAVTGMMKVDKMRRLWELRRIDFWLAMIALVGVLVVPTLEALGIAVAVSLGVLIWRASERRLTYLGRHRRPEPVDLRTEPAAASRACSSCVPTKCSSSQTWRRCAISHRRRRRDGEPRPAVVLLDLALTAEVDVPVVEAIEDLHERLAADGIELWLCYLRARRPGPARSGRHSGRHSGSADPAARGRRDPRLRAPEAGGRSASSVLADLLAYIGERVPRNRAPARPASRSWPSSKSGCRSSCRPPAAALAALVPPT